MDETVHLLRRMSDGDAEAEEVLYERILSELHARARNMMRRQRAEHTLQATALVNEAWMKLTKAAECEWQDRAHFLRTASRAMQCVLVDHARARVAVKRGGDPRRVDGEQAAGQMESWKMLALNDALESLRQQTPEDHEVAQLRIFAGLSCSEIAALTETPLRTVERRWTQARGMLRAAL